MGFGAVERGEEGLDGLLVGFLCPDVARLAAVSLDKKLMVDLTERSRICIHRC